MVPKARRNSNSKSFFPKNLRDLPLRKWDKQNPNKAKKKENFPQKIKKRMGNRYREKKQSTIYRQNTKEISKPKSTYNRIGRGKQWKYIAT